MRELWMGTGVYGMATESGINNDALIRDVLLRKDLEDLPVWRMLVALARHNDSLLVTRDAVGTLLRLGIYSERRLAHSAVSVALTYYQRRGVFKRIGYGQYRLLTGIVMTADEIRKLNPRETERWPEWLRVAAEHQYTGHGEFDDMYGRSDAYFAMALAGALAMAEHYERERNADA